MNQAKNAPSTDDILEVFDTIQRKQHKSLTPKEERFLHYFTTPEGRRVKRKTAELLLRKEPFIQQKDAELISSAFYRFFDVADYFPDLIPHEEEPAVKTKKLPFPQVSLENWEEENSDETPIQEQQPVEPKPLKKTSTLKTGKVKVRQAAKLPDFLQDDFDFFAEPPRKEPLPPGKGKRHPELDKDNMPGNNLQKGSRKQRAIQDTSFFDTEESRRTEENSKDDDASFEKAFQDTGLDPDDPPYRREKKPKKSAFGAFLSDKRFLLALVLVLLVVLGKSLSLILPDVRGINKKESTHVKKQVKRTPFPLLLKEGEILAIARFIRDSRGRPIIQKADTTEKQDKIVSTHILLFHEPEGYIDLSLTGRDEKTIDMLSYNTLGTNRKEEITYLKTFWDTYRIVEGVRLINPIVLKKRPRIVIKGLTIFLKDFPEEMAEEKGETKKEAYSPSEE